MPEVAAMLKAINAHDGWEAAETKARDVIAKLEVIRRKAAAQFGREVDPLELRLF